jgi:hypothetical protein
MIRDNIKVKSMMLVKRLLNFYLYDKHHTNFILLIKSYLRNYFMNRTIVRLTSPSYTLDH